MKRYKISKDGEKVVSCRKLDELVLPASKLKFCPDQLHNLNYIFRQKLEERSDGIEQNIILARSVAERLLQRLICRIGMIDSKFSSKYLVSLHQQSYANELNDLQYLFRIDSLSTPFLYEDDAIPKYSIIVDDPEVHAGYARVRLQGITLKHWSEYVNSTGYLRRDRIQSKLVELLAKATASEELCTPLDVDDSIVCGSPGKVVDAATLHHILHAKATEQVYYATGGSSPQFPDPRDFRLAIVDEPDGIRIRVEFLSPALANVSINIRLLVGIGVDYWPTSTDFPFRVSLGHSDCFLYHTAAKTGMYLIGFGVHSSAWQIRFPAAERTILNHYNPESTVRTILDAMSLGLNEINNYYMSRRGQVTYKILNYYILRTALFDELERDNSSPTNIIINWSPLYLSTIVLKIMDRLISSLQRENHPNYFFRKANLLANPGHLCDDDYLIEAHKLQKYLVKLFDDSLTPLRHRTEFSKMMTSINLETLLLMKWKETIDGLTPPPSTRGRRMCLAFSSNGRETAFTQYTQRQLEYIGFLLKNVLSVKENVWKNDNGGWIQTTDPNQQEHPIEDIIYILVTILEQARDTYLNNCTNQKIKTKLKVNFDTSTTKLVELVRKDKDITYTNITDDVTLVKIILKWLYKAMDQNRKYFAPVLRPYLSVIFTTSHGLSWHIEQLKKTSENEELNALNVFARLVNEGKLTPAQGLVEAYNKNWSWARNMLSMLEDGKLRLVLTPYRGKVARHVLSATACKKDGAKSKSKKSAKRSASFSTKSYFDTLMSKDNSQENSQPTHCILRDRSPMTLILKEIHRNGSHRCCGDIFQTLLSMHKINVLHDMSSMLPEEDRAELLEVIQRLTNEKVKKPNSKVWSKTLPHPRKGVLPTADVDMEKYTKLEESAGIKVNRIERRDEVSSETLMELIKKLEKKDCLIGSCRAARIRDDSNVIYLHESFKINTMSLKHRTIRK